MAVQLRLNIHWNLTTTGSTLSREIDVKHIYSMLHSDMPSQLGLQRCTLISFVIYSPNSSLFEEITVYMYLATTRTCQLQQFNGLNRKRIAVAVDEYSNFVFQVSLDTRPYDEIRKMPAAYSYRISHRCSGVIKITRDLCPEVQIQYSEVLSVPNGTVKDYLVSLFDNTERLNEYTSIKLCIDEYFKLKGLVNASSVFSSTITIIMGLIVPILKCALHI